MDAVLYLLVPIVGIACGSIGWPVLQDHARRKCEQAGREALLEGGRGRLAVTGSAADIGEPVRPSESAADCGYVTVIGATLITRQGVSVPFDTPWSAHEFVTTAQEIGKL